MKNVNGDFQIKIVDDGTPKKYLDKIAEKYSVEIIPTINYNQKSKNITEGKSNNGFAMPTVSWREAVEKASDYFLITEDDVWFCEKIDCLELIDQMQLNNIHLIKLGVLGIYSDDNYAEIKSLSQELETTYPLKTFTSNQFVMNMFMFNQFKFFTILYKLGLVDNETKRKYWGINSILMGLYQKEYWLSIWEDAKGKVDEKQQLRNAAVWFHKNKKAVFARMNQEVMRTTFQSLATGSYHEYGNHFDVNRMNYILNEA